MSTVEKPLLAESTGHNNKLRVGAIGVGTVVFMAMAGSAPITAMTGNVPVAVGFGNGIHAPGGFIVALIILFIFSIGYSAMSRHVTATGAFYGYISHGLGQTWGMASGSLATVAYIVFEASLIGIFASFSQTAIHSFGGPNISELWFAGGAIALIAVMGYFDISLSGKVLGVFLVTEVAILLIVGVAVLVKGGGPNGLLPGSLNPVKAFTAVPSGGGVVGSAGIGLFFAFWSWVGFETAAVYGEESKDPKRIVPRAVLLVVTIVGLLYVLISWTAVAGNGVHQAINISRSANPFNLYFGITRTFAGLWALDIYKVLIMTGSFACALAFHNAASRYMFALGRELPGKKAPGLIGRTHPTHKSPYVASAIQTVLTLAIVFGFFIFQKPSKTAPDVAFDYIYGLMAILGTAMVLICQSLCSVAVIWYFHVKGEHPETKNIFRTFLAPLVGAAGMGYVVYLLFAHLSVAAGAAAGSPVYKAMPYIIVGLAVVGFGYALLMKVRNPEHFATIGRTVLEEAQDRDALAAGAPVPAGAAGV